MRGVGKGAHQFFPVSYFSVVFCFFRFKIRIVIKWVHCDKWCAPLETTELRCSVMQKIEMEYYGKSSSSSLLNRASIHVKTYVLTHAVSCRLGATLTKKEWERSSGSKSHLHLHLWKQFAKLKMSSSTCNFDKGNKYQLEVSKVRFKPK